MTPLCFLKLYDIYLYRHWNKDGSWEVPFMAPWLMHLTRNNEVVCLIPGLCSVSEGSSIAMSCGVGLRYDLDPSLL